MELCIHMEELCMPYQEDQLSDLIAGIAQEAGHKDANCGRRFFARFYDKHPRLGLYKSSNMDIRRAEAATAHIRDSVFTKLQSLLDKLLLNGVLSQEDVKTRLDEHIYNMDEFGGDANGKRSRIIGARRSQEDKRGVWRKTVLTTGDHDPFHVTVLCIVRGNGELMSPVIIHSKPHCRVLELG